MQAVGKTWVWSPTWSEFMGVGNFDLLAADRGAYAAFVGGRSGGVCYIGARHCLPHQAQDLQQARSGRISVAAPPHPP